MKYLNIKYGIVAMLIVGMLWSCSENDDYSNDVKTENIDLSVLGLKGIDQIVIDGKIATEINDDLETIVKDAFGIHVDFFHKKLVISSNKEESDKYLSSMPELKSELEAKRRDAINNPANVKNYIGDIALDETVDISDGANYNEKAYRNHNYSLIGNHSDDGIIIFHNNSNFWMHPIVSVPNTYHTKNFYRMTPNSLLSNTSNSFHQRMGALETYNYDFGLRNSKNNATLNLLFFAGYNYNTNSQSYTQVSLQANTHRLLPSWIVKPNGYHIAKSFATIYAYHQN
jgi:hypothetical protein